MSVLHQHARADVEGSARAGARVGPLLLAEKPLTVSGLAQAPCFPPGGVDALVVIFVQIGGEFEPVGELTAENDVCWRQSVESVGVFRWARNAGTILSWSKSPFAFVLSLIMRLADLTAASALPLL